MRKRVKDKNSHTSKNTLLHLKLFGASLMLWLIFESALSNALGYTMFDDFETGVLATKLIFWLSTISGLAVIVMMVLLITDLLARLEIKRKK